MAKKRVDFHTNPEDFNDTRLPKGGLGEAQPVEVIRERKKRRVQLLTYDTLIDRMDTCAKNRGLSRAELFEKVMSEYLDSQGV